jgi:hypothetical protein
MRLHQTGRTALVVLALLMAGLALAGLLAATGSPTGVGHIAGFSLNIPHSLLLLVTAVASALAALTSRIGRLWAITQAALYTLVYVIGTAASTGHSEDTWLRLNTSDHFFHLGLALVSGVLSAALFWPTAAGAHAPARILPGEPPPTEQRPASSSEEESETTRDMAAAEVAVTEGNATPEQAHRVQEDAQRRADVQHRRAWNQFEESTGAENRYR